MKKSTAMVAMAVSGFIVLASVPLLAQALRVKAQVRNVSGLRAVPAEAVPQSGTFYQLQHGENPPLPFNPFPDLPVYSLSDGSFLVDDSSVDYFQLAAEAEATAAVTEAARAQMNGLPAPGEGGEPGGGPGGGPPSPAYAYSLNDLWLEIAGSTNSAAELIIHSPVTNGVYDLYCTTNLTPPAPWFWLARSLAGQTNFTVLNPPNPDAFYILGRTNDTDGGGLPDAWEGLITHGDPANAGDDLIPEVGIVVVDSVAAESDAADTAQFSVYRPAGSVGRPLTVGLRCSGTATFGADYALSSVAANPYPMELCVTIPAGQASVGITLTAVNDGLAEGTETATLTVTTNWPGYRVDPAHGSATAWILEEYTKTYTTTDDFNLGLMLGLEAVSNQLQFKTNLPAQFPYVNVACSLRGTVARINTTNGQVIGEYRTTPQNAAAKDYPSPSRTTVDQYGNVWVANRYDNPVRGGVTNGSITRIGLIIGGDRYTKDGTNYNLDAQGQYVKLSTATYNTCMDRDGDGYIRTSRGLSDILPWSNPDAVDSAGGVSSAEDEAITEYTRVACIGARTIAVDRFNDIWVGGHDGGRTHVKVNGLTGEPVPDSAFDANAGGYGGVVDGLGNLWSSDNTYGSAMRLKPPAVLPPRAGTDWQVLNSSGYGIAADPVHPCVWQTYGPYVVRRYLDGQLETDTNGATVLHDHDGGLGSVGRGLAVDARGHAWVAHGDGTTTIGHLDTNGVWLGNVPLEFNGQTSQQPIGVSVDAAGKIWVATLQSHNAMRIDPDAGAVVVVDGQTHHVGAVDLEVDLGATADPYNYSDMTGFNNRIVNRGGQPLKGYWSVVDDSGRPRENWRSVSWNASLTNGGAMEVWVRASDDKAALANGVFVAVSNNVPFSGVIGRYLEVRVALTRPDTNGWPMLYDLTLHASSTSLLDGFLDDTWAYETSNAVFSPDLEGAGPFRYQWFVQYPWTSEWVSVAGATNSELVMTNVDSWVDGTRAMVSVTSATGENLWLGPAELWVIPSTIVIPGYGSSGPASRYPATINVFDQPTNLASVTVTLRSLGHTHSADLDILLVSPSGTNIMLMSHVGGTNDVSNASLVFQQWQPLPPQSGAIPSGVTTSYSPSNYAQTNSLPNAPPGPYSTHFEDLIGSNPNGIWKLYIYDDRQGGVGSFSGLWQLGFTFQ